TRGRFVICGSNKRDTWEWDGFSWARKCTLLACTINMPNPLTGHAMAFDSVRSVNVLFGGQNGWSLWEWNGNFWADKCTAPPCSTSRPAARSDATLVFNSTTNQTFMFGGYKLFDAPANDLWAWDGSAWWQQCNNIPCNL